MWKMAPARHIYKTDLKVFLDPPVYPDLYLNLKGSVGPFPILPPSFFEIHPVVFT